MRSQFTLWPQVHPRHDWPGVVSGPLLKRRPYRQLPWPGEEREGAWFFDLSLPREKDGTPHVAFNPWLEARFRDGGHGGGVVSNCMNCHNRASFPDIAFLPIYRGDPDLQNDPAFAGGRLRTDFLWSVPDQSQ